MAPIKFPILFVGALIIIYLAFHIFFSSLPLNSNAVDATLLFSLVLITAEYAASTNLIVKETQKDRKSKHLENKIEKFYLPLINNNLFWRWNPENLWQLWNTNPQNESADSLVAKDFLNTYRKYSHLASKELEPILFEFKVFLDGTMGKEDFESFKDKFKLRLETDYKIYLKELEELTF